MDCNQEKEMALSAYTQAQLDALCEAYASGVTKVTYEGKTVEYRSLADLSRAIATITAALEGVAPRRNHYPAFSKGL